MYISKEKKDRVFKEFQKLQRKFPSKAVTIKALRTNLGVYEKFVERAIKKLIASGDIEKPVHGQYWLKKNWKQNAIIERKKFEEVEKEIQLIKQQLRERTKEKNYFKGGYRIGQKYIEALMYCESEEDWDLLRVWFTKMTQNKYEKYEQERAEAWDDYLEEIARREEQIKKENI